MSSTSQTGVTTTFAYDAFQREVSQTDGRGNTTRTVYDSLGRVSSTIDALGYATAYGYDAFGSLTNETVIGVAGTNTIERFYDSFGRDAGYALNGIRQSTLACDPDTYDYIYNTRSELTNATGMVDADYRYGYDFDDIGNRRSSVEHRTQSAEYTANNLNQYTAVDAFVRLFFCTRRTSV